MENSFSVSFKDELLNLIRKYHIDENTGIPDYILRDNLILLMGSLKSFNSDMDNHYGPVIVDEETDNAAV